MKDWGEGGARTNSSELLPLYFSELRYQSKINIKKKLCKSNFKCSNFVKTVSVNIVCKFVLSKQNIIPTKDKNVFNKYNINNIINTSSNNLIIIDNNYFSKNVGNSRLACNDGVIDPDKHNSSTSTTNYTFSIIPIMDFNIYSSNILTYTLIRNTFSNPLILGLSINIVTVLPIFGERRPYMSMTPYFTIILMKICMFSNHLERV